MVASAPLTGPINTCRGCGCGCGTLKHHPSTAIHSTHTHTHSHTHTNTHSVIVLDEAHERTIHTDVLFGLLKEVRARRQLAPVYLNASVCARVARVLAAHCTRHPPPHPVPLCHPPPPPTRPTGGAEAPGLQAGGDVGDARRREVLGLLLRLPHLHDPGPVRASPCPFRTCAVHVPSAARPAAPLPAGKAPPPPPPPTHPHP